jgi:cysteine synthase A
MVEKIVSRSPVVLFALEWCEFSWSVRKLFAEAGIEYESVDLDSVAYQRDDRGGDLRAALREVIGVPTIPQIFVGGRHLGGATETFDAYNAGSLPEALWTSGVVFNRALSANAYTYLPKWLHPRLDAGCGARALARRDQVRRLVRRIPDPRGDEQGALGSR